MSSLARKNILDIRPYEPGKPIEEVKRELGLKEIIKLASNENPLGPSPKAIRAIKDTLSGINRYPDGNCFYLRKKLAKTLNVTPKSIIFGNGSNEIIELALRAFLNPGEEVIISDPAFLVYALAAKVAAGRIKRIALDNFKVDLETVSKAVTRKTKLIFIDNPVNPTGTYVTAGEVESFLRTLPKRVIVLFDEAYYEFVDNRDFPDTLKYLKKNMPNIIVLRTFSKAHGLSGLRIGYGLACPELIDAMNRVRQPFNVNSLAQTAALASLGDKGHVRRTKRLVLEGKKFLYKNLAQMGLSYVPSAANFILVNVETDSRKLFRRMLKEGVIVRDMHAYNLKNFIRVTIGRERENKKFIAALKKCL